MDVNAAVDVIAEDIVETDDAVLDAVELSLNLADEVLVVVALKVADREGSAVDVFVFVAVGLIVRD